MSHEANGAKNMAGAAAKPAGKPGPVRGDDRHVAVPASPAAIRDYLGITTAARDRVAHLLTQAGALHVK